MNLTFKIFLLITLLANVLTINDDIKQNKKVKKAIYSKSSVKVIKNTRIIRNAIEDNKGENPEIVSTVIPKEEPKVDEESKLNTSVESSKSVPNVGEKIEREGEEDEGPVRESPREREIPTSSTASPPAYSPVTQPSEPSVPSVPSIPSMPPITPIQPTVPNRPHFPQQPTVPTNHIPHNWNYWDSPNWGTWGRNVPSHTFNWGQNWPSTTWSSVPSVQSVPSYNPNSYTPGSFGGMPSSNVPSFSFFGPQNPWPGHGFQFPGASPSVPAFSGFRPGGMPGYQPGMYPSNGHNPGYQPPMQPVQPRQDPGIQFIPRATPGAAPGADPNRPMGPMGPEFNNPDVTMIDPKLMPGGGRRGFSKFVF